ncbi:ABC transporter ATP-binding protein [Nocardiopsis nanhaiensis]
MRTEQKLNLQGVSKTFHQRGGSVQALDNITLDVSEGEFVSLIGASGCGKSTLLRLVDGLTKPSGGELILDGSQVTSPGPDRAFVFQQDRLLPWRTIKDNVAFGLEVQGAPKDEVATRCAELLELMGIPGFADAYPHELSGGMRQRVNIARALAVDPQVLLMDEPFAALDGQTREIMQAELMRVWQETKKTVLFVTHQIDEAVYLSDRIIVLTVRPGRVKQEIHVDIPRPRTLQTKRTPEFTRYVDEIWGLIEQEVRESMSMELRNG